ncbi:MAG TPA: VWA domain-containing protein [Thermoanaerobaculia bacterium]|nr:VWA domain-containing protein [Thermoanaerobaculia bacterium]
MSSLEVFHLRSLRFSLLAALTALPLAAGTAQAAQAAPPRDPSFDDTAHVIDVEVPVNVVGRDGKPVRGLTAADFEVYDEGTKQPVTGFDVVDLETLHQGEGQEEAAAFRQRVDQLDSSARRHFLLLFDLSFSKPTSVVKARLAARDFVLKNLHPTDLAAVATISLEYGPRLVVTFTPDRAQLARAIDTLGSHASAAGLDRDPLRFLVEDPALAQATSSGASQGQLPDLRGDADGALLDHLRSIAAGAEKSQRAFEVSRISSMTRALADMAKKLDSVQGRKHVIYFSEGFDSRLMLGRGELDSAEAQQESADAIGGRIYFVDSDKRFGDTGLQTSVNKMLEEFRRADCVIQAVDIAGLRATGSDADNAPRRSGEEALFYMANETGGQLFEDANDLGRQLSRVLDRTNVTYLLTFERADLKLDGAYHRLRVKANLPSGARLSHRAGYYAPRPFKDLDPFEKSLLASDGIASAAPRRDLPIHVLAAVFRANERQAYVPVILEIPGAPLLAGVRGDKLSLEIYAYVSDEKGAMRDFFTQTVGLEIGKGRESLAAGGIKYYGHLDLPPGRYRIRVLVRNSDTGRTGVESVPVEVPAWGRSQPALLPPLFFETPGRWLLVRERPERQQSTVVYPFTINGEPYVPAARPSLRASEDARLCLVAYNLGSGDLQVVGQVTAADGRVLAGGHLAVLERTATGIPGVDKLLATFRPTGLAAGDYVLRVGVTDPSTGRKEINAISFQVIDREGS